MKYILDVIAGMIILAIILIMLDYMIEYKSEKAIGKFEKYLKQEGYITIKSEPVKPKPGKSKHNS